jgi:hypothetical protein
MGGDVSKTGDERSRLGVRVGLLMGAMVGAGLSTRRSLGWWSVVGNMVAAGLVVVGTFYLVKIWQRRGGRVW